jgi:3-deoxy-D-arabino-heptulosonate 7-phosphate (DAHP) synthase
MIIIFKKEANLDDISNVTKRCIDEKFEYELMTEGDLSLLIITTGSYDKRWEFGRRIAHLPAVGEVHFERRPHPAIDSLEDGYIKVGDLKIGRGAKPAVIAGPPYLDTYQAAVTILSDLARLGVNAFKGAGYRPDFKLKWDVSLERALKINGQLHGKFLMPHLMPLLNRDSLSEILDVCDALIIETRYIHEEALREKLTQAARPVFLIRDQRYTVGEFLDAAEMLCADGLAKITLIEAGSRTAVSPGGATLDIRSLIAMKEDSPFPVLAYPSPVAATSNEVIRQSLAALAAGADGILLDVHPAPADTYPGPNRVINYDELSEVLGFLK